MKYGVITALSLTVLFSHAAIYKQVDVNGNISYSDVPLGKYTKEIETPESNNSSNSKIFSEALPKETETQLEKSSAKKPYVTFEIIAPKDQETIQNQAVLSVEIKLEPKIQSGDKIQLMIDNKLWGELGNDSKFSLTQIERGTHELAAILLDENQKIIMQSNKVTIYVHRARASSR